MLRFLLGFVVGFVVGVALLLSVGPFLRVNDGPAKADVVVSISGDTGARARTAAALYRAGYAPKVLFSGGGDETDATAPSSAEIMATMARAAGVPANAILIEPRARTTEENAAFVRDLMRERGLRTALLVTSPYHQRRAALVFSRAFAGTGLSFRNVPADDPSWHQFLWWADAGTRDLTLTELAKLALTYIGR